MNRVGLAEDKITWYSNSCCYRSTRFGEEKATWYSNPVWQTIVMVCKKVKLHGSQTRKNIPSLAPWAWKTWNYRGLKPDWRRNWFRKRKITGHSNRIFLMCRWISSLEGWLQDSQIFCEGGNGVHAIGKGIELQGAQTTPPSKANKAMFWKRKNCRVLKQYISTSGWFRGGDRITGLSTIVNGQLYWVWKGIGLYGTQTAV